jgi:hypothetical protein
VDSGIGIWIEFIKQEDRSYPEDIFRICQYGGICCVATFQQVLEFSDDLKQFLHEAAFENVKGIFDES